MDLYDYAKNIRNINIEDTLIKCIDNVRGKLDFLTEDRTCKIYSNYVADELQKFSISYRIINTLDLNGDYEHMFILINNIDKYYLVDLTFSQFNTTNLYWEKLVIDGFIEVDDNSFNEYLNMFGINKFIELDNVYYLNNNEFML